MILYMSQGQEVSAPGGVIPDSSFFVPVERTKAERRPKNLKLYVSSRCSLSVVR